MSSRTRLRRALGLIPRAKAGWVAGFAVLWAASLLVSVKLQASWPTAVTDPGVRGEPANAGGTVSGLNALQTQVFNDGKTNFTTVNTVSTGLGPRFDSNQCSSCHVQPATGGSGPAAPASNPLFSIYQLSGATNTMPTFELLNGPILVARFSFLSDLKTPDGTVHQLFTVTGRSDASGCNISQPDFTTAGQNNNLVFRQPLPTYGDGFLEIIQDSDLLANMSAVCAQTQFGICGTPNITEHDGSINRLGWKAQWRSLYLAAGEEYNVEQGVSNEFYPNELDETSGCVFNPVPEDGTNFAPKIAEDQFTGAVERMAYFMRFLAGPAPVAFNPSAQNGQRKFNTIGCNECHTVSFTTPVSDFTALSQKTVKIYSDLLLHHMGPCLADNIVQGAAQGDMFRTTPLWGIGQRMWFMHDGRTSDLLQAIQDHFCLGNSQYPASEANTVINNFNALIPNDQQSILNFLRDL
jgi:CxxC motif-containing protein (DUF1111 family)